MHVHVYQKRREQADRTVRRASSNPGGQHRKPLILWNSDPIGPSGPPKHIGVPANLQNDRVQTGFDFEGLTLLIPGLLLLSKPLGNLPGHRGQEAFDLCYRGG